MNICKSDSGKLFRYLEISFDRLLYYFNNNNNNNNNNNILIHLLTLNSMAVSLLFFKSIRSFLENEYEKITFCFGFTLLCL